MARKYYQSLWVEFCKKVSNLFCIYLYGMPKEKGISLCGFFVGEMIGSALSAFHSFHKREPTANEHAEIVDIIEVYAEQIRDFFAKFNPQ